MFISHLSLTNFRNYSRLELSLPQGVSLLHGANAQGKTNVLEGIYYLATTRSPQADNDQQIINWEAVQTGEPIVVGRLVAQISAKDGPHQVEMRLILEPQKDGSKFRREALIDRRKVRLMDLLGNMRVVLFLPSDVEMIGGSPSRRRRYLDIMLCQIDAVYCRALSQYNKIIEQRNASLKQLAESGRGREVLAVLTEKLIQQGSLIFAHRARHMADLAAHTARIHYEGLTGGRETIRLGYLPRLQPQGLGAGDDSEERVNLFEKDAQWLQKTPDNSLIEERFAKVVKSMEARDIASGSTTVGPHRDDWRFWVNGRSLSSFGSRGQQRSAMLALKLAEIEVMANLTGEMPILLLDEVVAELDEERRELLLTYVRNGAQAILTATDPNMFPKEFLREVNTMFVHQGRITGENEKPVVESDRLE